jgi:hypothetical protein
MAEIDTVEEENTPEDPTPKAEEISSADPSDGELTVRQAYAALKKRQRPPPKGGYPFSKNDHVMTKMGKAPPSPCKVCGSSNHWDRECPDWNVYIEKQKRGILVTTSSPVLDETDLIYHSAYVVLLEGRISEESF